jgi:hypothetical protein
MGAVIDADADDAPGSGTTGRNCRVDNARSAPRPAVSLLMSSSAFPASAWRKLEIFPSVSGAMSMTPSPTTTPKLASPSAT